MLILQLDNDFALHQESLDLAIALFCILPLNPYEVFLATNPLGEMITLNVN